MVASTRAEVLQHPTATRDWFARENLIAYIKRMFPGYQVADHHWQIAKALHRIESGEIRYLAITMPPRHGKSSLASEHFPPWYLGRNPDNRIIATSYASDLAYRFSRRARNQMATPEWPFPISTAGDLSSVKAWDIADHRGGYYAAGVGGGIAGHGANLLLVDDPVASAAQADSATYRDAAWEWFTQDAIPRLNPGAFAIVMIGTRWHADDLIGRALQMPDTPWVHLDMPAINDAGEALWPSHFPIDRLETLRTQMGSRAFTALYQQRPSPAEGGMFKRHWWKRYRVLPVLHRVEQFMDSAFKTGVGNDYSVIATWGDDGAGNLYVIDVWRDRVEYPDLMRAAHDQYGKHQHRAPGLVLNIEDKASGQSAIQTLDRPLPSAGGVTLRALPVIPFPLPANTSKESRAEGVSPIVEAGRVFLPEGADWVADFIEEHANFPLGAHDDMVDTTSMAINRLHRAEDDVVRIGSYLGRREA